MSAYLIFKPFDGKAWPAPLRALARAILGGPYGHVSILWRCPHGQGLAYLERTACGLHVLALPEADDEKALAIVADDALDVVKVDFDPAVLLARHETRFAPWPTLSCVGLVKSMLAVSWPLVVTPAQLHRRLAP